MILGNKSFIHYDPERYPNFPTPRAEYGNGDPYQRDYFTFGVGRRICPSSRLAENSLDSMLVNSI